MQTDARLVHLQFLQYHVLSDSKPLVSCAVCLNILVLNMYSVTVFQGSVYPEQTLFFFCSNFGNKCQSQTLLQGNEDVWNFEFHL